METSIVRENLMTRHGYSPYCGNRLCGRMMPRAKWDNNLNQFTCLCGWISEFPEDFITKYKQKWNII